MVVEKVEGIVEPNISSPTKSNSKLANEQSCTIDPAGGKTSLELDSVPAGLSARIEG